MELVTILIWALRISLPIVLFIIFFQHQRPKDKQDPGPQGNAYARSVFLAHRKAPAVRQAAVPAEYDNITLKDSTQAPELFANTRVPRGAPGGRPGGGTRGAPREPRERRDKEGKEGGRRERPDRKEPREAAISGDLSEASPVVAAEPVEDKQHLESLLNYVAFNRQDPLRTFHNEGEAPPPPPAHSKPQKPQASEKAEESETAGGSTTEATKANADAQLVLKGAIEMKRGGVARDIYAKMTDSQVEITSSTFTLMIEACVQSADLKGASDLLMKMETSGHTPETKLLDQVMDLYSAQKGQREKEKEAEEQIEEANLFRLLGMEADAPRAKLKSTAKVFVPSFGVPPPPSGPRPGEKKKSEDPVEKPADDNDNSKNEEENTTTPAATADAVVSALTQDEGGPRTRLTARAKPFNPGMPVMAQ